ncbi:hypothetical protein Vadar_011704 [Vaccinium darrowii]|uniref:Uncharacterized protein n=1 Tax=Vaccinium darrowii TaxID=229202 RepID=A0ACB7XGW8_9ERIC|nr:hypothetical protein Vadar_011704 [Vaccinium darrowii]
METNKLLALSTKATPYLFLLTFIALSSSIISAQVMIDDRPPAPVVPPEPSDQIDPPHTLSFFMHDIVGGSTPSARIVTNHHLNGQIPFAKPNGVPLDSNSDNIPFLTGLGGTTSSVIHSNRDSGLGLPIMNGLQKAVFGTITVLDDELTEGRELGSGLVGKAQGFYVASSEDGRSHTMAFTVMLESGGYVDSINLFGVHRMAVSESQLAIMGGTGKYVNAMGFATVRNVAAANQGLTDGIETLLEFIVFVSY